MKNLEKIFKALGNKRRMEIVQYVHVQREANVGEIAREIGLSFRATSRHLNVLRSAGILDRQQRSLHMYYRVPAMILPEVKYVLKLLIG